MVYARYTHLMKDVPTGLLNRPAWQRTFGNRVRQNPSGALLVLDLEKFNATMDVGGWPLGHECLRTVGRAVAAILQGYLVGRVGMDELLVHVPDAGDAQELAENLKAEVDNALAEFRERVLLQVPSYRNYQGIPVLTAAVGIARITPDDRAYPGSVQRTAMDAVNQRSDAQRGTIFWIDVKPA